mmetsp:Transcript_5626/g.14762  ORF Transcript_5626/g.14762 Transcript_5626/m.14762 type:complete len:203 (+) Transcript_5626:53-661(+)
MRGMNSNVPFERVSRAQSGNITSGMHGAQSGMNIAGGKVAKSLDVPRPPRPTRSPRPPRPPKVAKSGMNIASGKVQKSGMFFRSSGKRRGAESGPVDVNTATAEELIALKFRGMGPHTAAKIVEERDARGPFASLSAIGERVSGVGPLSRASRRRARASSFLPPRRRGGPRCSSRLRCAQEARWARRGLPTGGRVRRSRRWT